MITVRQIQRFWSAKQYDKLLAELIGQRSENSTKLLGELTGIDAAAAMTVIRLDELTQSLASLYSDSLRILLRNQRPDGGWGTPAITALCLKALLCGRGTGPAVDRGLDYLARMQKTEGIWPTVALRRMPVDPFVSAYILMQLGDSDRFRETVRFADAVAWFEHNEMALDESATRLWRQAGRRCRIAGGMTSIAPAMLFA